MTARVMMSVMVAAVVAATVAASAQDFGGRQGGRAGGRGFGPMGSVLATALDANRDNAISAAEIDGAPGALKAIDRNGDGRLAGEELLPAMGPGGRGPGGREGGEREGRREGGREGGGREGRGGNMAEPGETPATSPDELAAMLMTFDRNQDGNLEKSEVPERMLGIFDRADVNKDGKVNADEIKKSASSTRQLNERGGREGFEREGREGGREGLGREGRGPGGMPGDRLMTALDTNKDGVISADEMAAAPTALRMLDANKDGQLTADEFRQPVRIG